MQRRAAITILRRCLPLNRIKPPDVDNSEIGHRNLWLIYGQDVEFDETKLTKALISYLYDNDPYIRRYAAEALEFVFDPRDAVNPLGDLIRNENDEKVLERAMTTLASIAPQEAIPSLICIVKKNRVKYLVEK